MSPLTYTASGHSVPPSPVTFIAAENHRPLAGTNLFYTGWRRHMCVNNLFVGDTWK